MLRVREALLALAAATAHAEMRTMTVEFAPSECVACTQSLPERLGRIRGVVRAELAGGGKPAVKIEFAAGNRVRPGRVRETIEQDGTKWVKAGVEASGVCVQEGRGWLLRLFEGDAGVSLKGRTEAGACSVTGVIGGDGVLVAQ